VGVFILPPSLAELERRLRGRGTDADDVIARRLAQARADMTHYIDYDYVVVNERLDEALDVLAAIVIAERMRTARRSDLDWLLATG
jgi:guanylate kinase